MARPDVSVKHIEDSALMPPKLTRGRIYFVDDEGTLVVDHGRGAVTYGKRPGPPGPPGPAGDPQPMLQEQIDSILDSVFSLAQLTERLRERMPYADRDKETTE